MCVQKLTFLDRALYLRGDPYETSDAVFGVKDSLVVDLKTVTPEQAKEYGVAEGCRLLTVSYTHLTLPTKRIV